MLVTWFSGAEAASTWNSNFMAITLHFSVSEVFFSMFQAQWIAAEAFPKIASRQFNSASAHRQIVLGLMLSLHVTLQSNTRDNPDWDIPVEIRLELHFKQRPNVAGIKKVWRIPKCYGWDVHVFYLLTALSETHLNQRSYFRPFQLTLTLHFKKKRKHT